MVKTQIMDFRRVKALLIRYMVIFYDVRFKNNLKSGGLDDKNLLCFALKSLEARKIHTICT